MLKAIYLSLAMLFTACQAQTTSPILEVIGVYHDDKTGIDGIMLMEVEKGRRLERFHTKLNPQKHGSLAVGDRVQITGNYQEREIRNIKKITRLANPDKHDAKPPKEAIGNRKAWHKSLPASLPISMPEKAVLHQTNAKVIVSSVVRKNQPFVPPPVVLLVVVQPLRIFVKTKALCVWIN